MLLLEQFPVSFTHCLINKNNFPAQSRKNLGSLIRRCPNLTTYKLGGYILKSTLLEKADKRLIKIIAEDIEKV